MQNLAVLEKQLVILTLRNLTAFVTIYIFQHAFYIMGCILKITLPALAIIFPNNKLLAIQGHSMA